MRTNVLSVWLVGFNAGADCARMAHWLDSRVLLTCLTRQQLRSRPKPGDTPELPADLLLVHDCVPDDFNAADVEQLLTRFPLTRMLCLYGDWCESAGRTRSAWPIALRTPVGQALARVEQELVVISGGCAPLPATATREEAFSAVYWDEVPAVTKYVLRDGQVGYLPHAVVHSPDREYQRMLTEWWSASSPTTAAQGATPRVVLWDADPLPEDRQAWAQTVDSVRRAESADAVVALVGFPREHDRHTLLEAGVAAVVPKLAPLATLEACLHSLPPLSRASPHERVGG